MAGTLSVRPATSEDAGALGRMGAELARQHHGFDRARFMVPQDLESGYRWWLGKELKEPDAVVLVAERDGDILGYAYGRMEGRDWNLLLDAHGGFHDLWVEPQARRSGAGRALVEEMIARLTALGAKQIVLSTAWQNESARKLFTAYGFRPTMVEMTR